MGVASRAGVVLCVISAGAHVLAKKSISSGDHIVGRNVVHSNELEIDSECTQVARNSGRDEPFLVPSSVFLDVQDE